MTDWRASILKEFVPHVARLTLVADPDDLLVEEGIQQGLRNQGFEVMRFDDPMAFRFAYESRFRSRWDRGESGDLVVILDADVRVCKGLPFDLLQAGRSLTFGLAALFPGLSYPVVASLDRADLDPLVHAREMHPDETLGENSTKDFILRQVFQIAPELIRAETDLLRLLMRRHYRRQRIPAILDERLIQLLRQRELFDDWALEKIIPNGQAFFGFLQERWPLFLKRLLERLEGNTWMTPDSQISSYGMKYAGPAILPFDHDDVHIYMDNIFLEGLLKPITFHHASLVKLNWALAGIHHDPEADRKRRLEGLFLSCQTLMPTGEGRHREWQQFAQVWSQLTRLIHDPDKALFPGTMERFVALRERLDTTFGHWMEHRFAGLHNQPAMPPVMVHHIPREIARRMTSGSKAALVVLDGMSMEQWLILREVLGEQRPGFSFQEESVFAWVPTITSISRQAIFSGNLPLFFPTTLHTTQQEPLLWKQFWDRYGVASTAVGYLKGLGDGPLAKVAELVTNPRTRVMGLVVDMIDRIMHGMELGSAGMQSAVRQWARQGFMAELLDLLHSHGFQVVLTSDHGNVEATGIGRPAEGVTADVRGERCRIYPDPSLRTTIGKKFLDVLSWSAPGLPDGCHPLLATRRTAFITKGNRIVGHGGITLEEVIVPCVRLEGGV